MLLRLVSYSTVLILSGSKDFHSTIYITIFSKQQRISYLTFIFHVSFVQEPISRYESVEDDIDQHGGMHSNHNIYNNRYRKMLFKVNILFSSII